jgi:hypothetical protein
VFGRGCVPKIHHTDVADATRDAVLVSKCISKQHHTIDARVPKPASRDVSDKRTFDMQVMCDVSYSVQYDPLTADAMIVLGSDRIHLAAQSAGSRRLWVASVRIVEVSRCTGPYVGL